MCICICMVIYLCAYTDIQMSMTLNLKTSREQDFLHLCRGVPDPEAAARRLVLRLSSAPILKGLVVIASNLSNSL